LISDWLIGEIAAHRFVMLAMTSMERRPSAAPSAALRASAYSGQALALGMTEAKYFHFFR